MGKSICFYFILFIIILCTVLSNNNLRGQFLLELEFRFKPKGTIHRGLTWAVQILKIKQITEVVNNPQDKIIKPN
jgi:hypothetical protein